MMHIATIIVQFSIMPTNFLLLGDVTMQIDGSIIGVVL